MQVTLCDRCGTPIPESYEGRDIVKISRYVPSEYNYVGLDFCPACRSSLVEWLGNKEEFDGERPSKKILHKMFEEQKKRFLKTLEEYAKE